MHHSHTPSEMKDLLSQLLGVLLSIPLGIASGAAPIQPQSEVAMKEGGEGNPFQ